MKRNLKKQVAAILAVVMICSCFQFLTTLASEPTQTYELYPSVHDISYDAKQTELKTQVNVVAEDGIDTFTRAKIEQVMGLKGFSIQHGNLSYSNAVVNGKTNVLLGIHNSNGTVDAYFKENHVNDSHLTNIDAYSLIIREDTIAILGKDTDATFYGITTLKEIFQQMETNLVEELTIYDYADIKGRGFIEGYYGDPWSVEDRAQLMRYGGDYKMNNYVYAPKDDPYHNKNWRTLYDDEKLKDIEYLARAGNESKCYYVYALHTFMHNAVRFDSDASYQEDLEIIKQKFTQVMDVGVRQFAILADDAGVPQNNPNNYIRLMNDLDAWMKEKAKTVPGLKTDILFCPHDYWSGQSGWENDSIQEMHTLKQLPSSVPIIQTGGTIWGHASSSFINSFYNYMNRPVYLWINWPCSDNTKDSLIMDGNEEFLNPNIDPEKVAGVILNPMQQAEANKSALFANADYTWNVWKSNEEARENWEDSFKYMDHQSALETKSSTALRELSRHMKNSNTGSRGESAELAPKLDEFLNLLKQDGDYIVQAEELIQEFTTLKEYAVYYKEHPGNERTRDQLIYWMDCWEESMDAGINYLNAAIALKNEATTDEIWEYFTTGQAAFEVSKTHSYHYVDHLEYAAVGTARIKPFLENLESELSLLVSPMVNPNIQITKLITSRMDKPSLPSGKTALEALTDGNTGSEVVWKNPNNTVTGDYIGLRYTKPISLRTVAFQMGTASNPNDTFGGAKIQYTEDGKNWLDIAGTEVSTTAQTIKAENLDFEVLGVRLIATKDRSNMWLGCREIEINKSDAASTDTYAGEISLENQVVASGNLSSLNDGDRGTSADLRYQSSPNLDYTLKDAAIKLTFADGLQPLGIVYFKQNATGDMITKGTLEYTVDGTNWVSLGTYENKGEFIANVSDQNIKATAVRVRNLERVEKWWRAFELEATPPQEATEMQYHIIKTPEWHEYTQSGQSEANLHDGNDDTSAEYYLTGDKSIVGDYIGYDLGGIFPIGDVHVVIGGSRDAGNKWLKYKLEYSLDNVTWTTYKEYTGVTSGKDVINENLGGISARYIRMTNMQEVNRWVHFSEFDVKQQGADTTAKYIYTNTNLALSAEHSDDRDAMTPSSITLADQEYIGYKFARIKDLKQISIDLSDESGLTLQVSNNAVHWETVSDRNNPGIGRYVRLINQSGAEVQANLNSFIVTSNEVEEIALESSNVSLVASWGDTRENGAAFDGDIETRTKFAGLPNAGDTIIYDLGQSRNLNNVKLYCQDSATDYIRDANMYLSDDLNDWGSAIMQMGDGVENSDDANVSALQSGVYQTSSRYPNKVYAESIPFQKSGRYLKIEFTARNQNRAVEFNEIVLNDGEYVPAYNDPTFVSNPIEVVGFVPYNLLDGDLKTSYKPDTSKGATSGSILYRLSENTETKRFNVLQSGATISNADVIIRGYRKGETVISEATIGKLERTLNAFENYEFDHIFEIEIQWNGIAPNLQEIILFNDYEIVNGDISELQSVYNQYKDKLNSDLYTPSTKPAFEKAMAQADKVIKMPVRTQYLIDDTLARLNKAIGALVEKATDIQEFMDYVHVVKDYEESAYLSYHWQEFKDALTLAQAVVDDIDEKSQAEVDDAYAALQSAAAKLVTKQLLNEKLAYLEAVKQLDSGSDYTKKTLDAFLEKVDHYESILADEENLTSDAVKNMETELDQLKQALVDLKPLKDAIKDAEKNYGESAYDPDVWSEYQSLLNQAKEIVAKEDATKEEVQNAIKACEDATAVLKANATQALQNELDRLSVFNNDDHQYTDATFQALQTVVSDASAYLQSGVLVDETTFAWIAKLQEAENALVNLTVINQLLKEADTLEADWFTANSWNTFAKAVSDAQKELEREDITKDEVAELTNALKVANADLVDVRELKAAIEKAEAITDTTMYTPLSAKTFEDALKVATDLLSKADANAEELAKACEQLTNAQEALIIKADKSDANELLKDMKSVFDQKDEYLEAGFIAFEKAYQTLENLCDDENVDQPTLDQAVKALQDAYDHLEKPVYRENEDFDVVLETTTATLPEDIELVVTRLEEDAVKDLLPKQVENIYPLDISLYQNGVKIQPNGSVKVKIRIPDGMDRNRMMLYHIKDQAQEVIFEIVGDDVVFEASSFSPYVLVELRETQLVDPSKPVQPSKPANPNDATHQQITGNQTPNTGDDTNLQYWILLCMVMGAALYWIRKAQASNQ